MEPGSWWCWLLLTSSTNQRNVHELTMPYSLRTIKHFNYPFQGRSRSLDLLPVAHFACQSNKAIPFYFTQNSVSAFLFRTGEQRPNFSNRWLWFSHLITSNSLRCHGLQHARLCCPSLSPGVCSNSCPLSQWCFLTISSSIALFSF